MRLKKRLIIVGILAVIAGYVVFNHYQSSAYPHPDATFVKVDKVKQGSIPVEVQSVGTLVAANNIQIAPEIAGTVAKVLFQDGEFVKQGTPLIQLDDAVYQARFASVQADYQLSETTYDRMSILAKKGIISKQDMEKAAADLKEKAAAEQENKVNLNGMLLTAPFDGMVGKSKVSPGDYVSVGQALVSLTNIRHLHVEYNIPEKYLGLIQMGQEISVTATAFPGKVFKGKVAFISPTINTQDRTITLYAEIPNESLTLRSGLFVNVTQSLGADDTALLVPAKSLMATIDGHQVYKVVNGKAQSVPVEIGLRTTDSVQILKGLTANDAVVTEGQEKIRDGADVAVKL